MTDDIHDEGRDLSDEGPLGKYLSFCARELVPAYEKADGDANVNQRRHRRFTGLAGALGAIGLAFAAVNIAFPDEVLPGPLFPPATLYEWRLFLEAAFSLFAATLVALGLVLEFHRAWLIARYKAERLRLLKFQKIVEPDFWCAGGVTPKSERDFATARDKIVALGENDLPALAHAEDAIPPRPSATACEALDRAQRLVIVAYYRRKRLDFQIDYFARAAERIEKRWIRRPGWLPLVFFTSVAFAAFHVAAEHAGTNWQQAKSIALAISFGIPALWAAARTYRSANEFGRNENRSLAKNASLSTIRNRLDPDGPPDDVFSDLGLCEYVLATDLGEWLRLMREAEWYG
ncbi:MAG TPA: hypothetical protein VMQ61_08360 [Thermoanaerobaculia bacterium]|nr:hypothetical protein [Thermoanaerobaculia bacterium]